MIKKIIYNSKTDSRLDQFLKLKLKDISRTKIQKLIKSGNIQVDGFNVKPSFILSDYAEITFNQTIDNNNEHIVPEDINLDILYEDDDILAINKQAGLVVHPGIKHQSGTLLNGLMYYCKSLSHINLKRPGIIHRLDKETSGVIIIAKNDFSHYFISEQFANRKILKVYKALVWGKVMCNGIVEGNINRSSKNRIAFELGGEKGKYSFSKYNLEKRYAIPVSLLKVFPKTGRTHQIRVHLSSLGFPILNDALYYKGQFNLNAFHQKYKKNIDKITSMITRVALHAENITFIHPSSKDEITISAPYPLDFNKTINFLESINE